MSDSNTFTTIDGAQQVLTGAYDWLTNGWLAHMTNQYIFFLPDIMGDDALVTPDPNYNYGRFVSPYQYTVSPGSTYTDDPWKGCYSIIDNTNAILDNIGNLAESAERNRIEGEALSLRAYTYHFLVRMYAKPVNKYPDNPSIILRISSGTEDLPRATVKMFIINLSLTWKKHVDCWTSILLHPRHISVRMLLMEFLHVCIWI